MALPSTSARVTLAPGRATPTAGPDMRYLIAHWETNLVSWNTALGDGGTVLDLIFLDQSRQGVADITWTNNVITINESGFYRLSAVVEVVSDDPESNDGAEIRCWFSTNFAYHGICQSTIGEGSAFLLPHDAQPYNAGDTIGIGLANIGDVGDSQTMSITVHNFAVQWCAPGIRPIPNNS